jgi:hypothetical protein
MFLSTSIVRGCTPSEISSDHAINPRSSDDMNVGDCQIRTCSPSNRRLLPVIHNQHIPSKPRQGSPRKQPRRPSSNDHNIILVPRNVRICRRQFLQTSLVGCGIGMFLSLCSHFVMQGRRKDKMGEELELDMMRYRVEYILWRFHVRFGAGTKCRQRRQVDEQPENPGIEV